MAKLKLGLIVGSNRQESINRQMALALAKLGEADFEAKLIQIDDLPMYNQDHEQPVPAPFRHGRQEFTGVAFGIPPAGVGVGPLLNRRWIQVVENALHHAGIQQQSLNPMSVPGAPSIRRLAVEVEVLPYD